MDSIKIKEYLEKERAGVIDASRVAVEQLAEAEAHMGKLKICIFQLQGQVSVYDKLLADETLIEQPEDAASEVINDET